MREPSAVRRPSGPRDAWGGHGSDHRFEIDCAVRRESARRSRRPPAAGGAILAAHVSSRETVHAVIVHDFAPPMRAYAGAVVRRRARLRICIRRRRAAAARAEDLAPVPGATGPTATSATARAQVRGRRREAQQRLAEDRGLSASSLVKTFAQFGASAGRARHVGAAARLRRRRGARSEPRPDAGAGHELRPGPALEGRADRQGVVGASREPRHQDRGRGSGRPAASPARPSPSCRPTTPRA